MIPNSQKKLNSQFDKLQGLIMSQIDPKYHPRSNRKPSKKMKRQNIIYGKDRRLPVHDTRLFPYHCIGTLVSSYDEENVYHGTATLVAPDIIVTCAHNVYYKDDQNKIGLAPYKVNFFLGMNGGYAFAERQCVAPYFYDTKYQNIFNLEEDREYDWAFIRLKQDITEVEPLPLILEYPQILNSINIYGYPKDKAFIPDCYYLYGMKGTFKVNQNDNNKIEYMIDTTGGQSGSALIIQQNNQCKGIIGVHTTGCDLGNSGIKIDDTKFKLARFWYQKEQKKPFRVSVRQIGLQPAKEKI